MQEKTVIPIPLNLTDEEICAALKTQGIRAEDIEISRKDVKVWYDYHPSAKDPSSDFEQALLAASAAKSAAETERETIVKAFTLQLEKRDSLIESQKAEITALQETLLHQEIITKVRDAKIVGLEQELESYKKRESEEKQERTRSVLAIAAINERGAYKKCEDCDGSGYAAHTMYAGGMRCETCDGTGEVKK
jgi:hypothetical protein